MIVFLRDGTIPGPKLLDIEITNTFPLIALSKQTYLIGPTQEVELLKGYDHIAIPPDFRLHISGPNDHLFFDIIPVKELLENGQAGSLHFFSIVGLPSDLALPLVQPGRTRTWYQIVIISPFKDREFNASTRLFVDFFLHHLPISPKIIDKTPFVMPGMRLATDRSGSIFGPYIFADLQRQSGGDRRVAFSLRMGFANIEYNDSNYIYSPLKVFQKRPRLEP